jgi:hypothetical protein
MSDVNEADTQIFWDTMQDHYFPSESVTLSKPPSFNIFDIETKSDTSLCCWTRSVVREKEIEIKEMKEQMTELVGILRHSESRRRELEKQSKQKEQTTPMATTPPVRFLPSCNIYSLLFQI